MKIAPITQQAVHQACKVRSHSQNTKITTPSQHTWRIGLVISILLLLTACSDYLAPSVTSAAYAVLPIAPMQPVYGASLTVNYDPTALTFVDVVGADGGTVGAVNLHSPSEDTAIATMDVALVGARATQNTLGYIVFAVKQSDAAVDIVSNTVLNSELQPQSAPQTPTLMYVQAPPQPVTMQQINNLLIPGDLQASFAGFQLGDYDQSGSVEIIDVVRILQVLTGQTNTGSISDYQYFISDFTANGRIDLLDAVAALQKVVGAPSNLVTQTSGSLTAGTTVTLVLFNSGSDAFTTTPPTITAPAGVTVTGPNPSVPGQSFAYSVQVGANATGSLAINAGGANQASLPISGSGGGGGNGGTGDPLLDIVFYTTDTSTAINPSPVTGQMTVRANFDLGSASADSIQLLLDGVVAQTQPVLGTQSQADLSVDTSEFDCDTLTPEYPNGDYDINVRLVLEDGSFVNARNAATFNGITFGNADTVTLEVLSGNNVQASGVTWYGGGDVEFRVCPIIYDTNGSAVEQVVVNPERNNGGDTLNIGAGAGLPRTINRGTAPNFFTFTAFQAPNQNYEDSRAPVRRTTLFNVDALDANSLNIASLVSDPYYLDFKGPSVTGQVRYRRFNFGTNTRAPAFQENPIPLSATNLQDSNRYIGPNTPIAAPVDIFDEGVGLPAGYQPGIDVIPGNATNVLATLAVSDSTTGQDIANELNVFTTTNVVTPTTGYRIQLTDGTEDRLGNTMSGTEIGESRSDILGFDFDAPAIANVGPAPATNPNAGGIYSNRFLPVLAINEDNPNFPAPIIEAAFGNYNVDLFEREDFVFSSIFRAQLADSHSGLDDGDVTNNVRAVLTRKLDLINFGRPPLATLPNAANVMGDVDTFGNADAPFDKTIAVMQNGMMLPLVDAEDASALSPPPNDGLLDVDGYALDVSGGTSITPNTINFVQSGNAIIDAQINFNVIFYDAVGNASNPNATSADTAFEIFIDRTQPEVSFRGFVSPLDVSGSASVTTTGEIRVFDANLDVDNSYIIVTRFNTNTFPGTAPPPTTVVINGVPLDVPGQGARQAGISFAQVGIINSPNFQPLELTFPGNTPNDAFGNGSEYVVIIRASDLARQLDEGESSVDGDSLPQARVANTVSDPFFDTLFGRGNTVNDNFTIVVVGP